VPEWITGMGIVVGSGMSEKRPGADPRRRDSKGAAPAGGGCLAASDP
jgi:hypothetical protein